MKFEELTDRQWEFIKPLLPPQPIVGRKRANDRNTINGILFVLVSGSPWRDMPERYGSYVTAWRRLKRWTEEGIWGRILAAVRDRAYRSGDLNLDVIAIDSSFVEAKRGAKMSNTMDTRSDEV
jgi:transposase